MEHCLTLFVRHRTQLDEEFIWSCFAQVVLALKECHRRKDKGVTCPVLHRDIKPGNIMLDSKGRVKVGDFGLAKQLASQSKYAYTHVGTPFYMSPVSVLLISVAGHWRNGVSPAGHRK